MTTDSYRAPVEPQTPVPKAASPGIEILLVLGVSLGISAITSWINFLDIQTQRGGFSHATATLNQAASVRQWVDLSYHVADLVSGVAPALLALYLLSRTPFAQGFGIGLDRLRVRRESLYGFGFFCLIGIPGLALVYVARKLGVNAQIEASGLADTWYRYPLLVFSAIQNGVLEEIVMIGFVLTRLRQLDWTPWKAIALSAAIRGSYHTYQGLGGFVGNFVMGAIFGWWFTRTRRVVPLVIAHSLLDIASFVGYAAMHGHISWI